MFLYVGFHRSTKGGSFEPLQSMSLHHVYEIFVFHAVDHIIQTSHIHRLQPGVKLPWTRLQTACIQFQEGKKQILAGSPRRREFFWLDILVSSCHVWDESLGDGGVMAIPLIDWNQAARRNHEWHLDGVRLLFG